MIDLDNYLKQGEPLQRERGYVWHTAIGLQRTDGLKPSDYLIATANRNINSDITLEQAQSLIDSYYKTRPANVTETTRTEEADKVAVRIAMMLAEKAFSFSLVEYIAIHRRLFEGVYKFAGRIRDYNISRSEWVLNGETVYYASARSIRDTLDYDFSRESEFSYKGLPMAQTAEHIAKFTSGLWQIHAFGEGNTRTTAVFVIEYLRTFGFDVTNDIFAEYAWYFRNALVRANYNDFKSGIHATQEYLNRFFANLMFGEKFVLKNRELLVRAKTEVPQSVPACVPVNVPANVPVSVPVSVPVKITVIHQKILSVLKENPYATTMQMAKIIGVSDKTIKRALGTLKTAGMVERIGSDKTGHWTTK